MSDARQTAIEVLAEALVTESDPKRAEELTEALAWICRAKEPKREPAPYVVPQPWDGIPRPMTGGFHFPEQPWPVITNGNGG